jgi:hypothetical protein
MRFRVRATWVAFVLVLSLLASGPSYAAQGLWDRAWGVGVVTGSPSTLEICTVVTDCLRGADYSANGQGVAVDPVTGAVWTSDGDGNRLRKFTADGEFLLALGKDVGGAGVDVCTVASACQAADHGFHGAKGGQFYFPSGLATDQDGNLFVADTYNHRIQEFTAAGVFVRAWGFGAASGGANNQFEVCTTVASCTASLNTPTGLGGDLQQPYSVTVDNLGGVYVGDTGRIQKFAITSVPSNVSFVSTWGWDVVAGGGTSFEICTQSAQCKQAGSGNGLGGDVNDATGVAVAGSELFVADGGYHRVQVFTLDGAFQRAWGQDVGIDPEDEENPNTGFEICTVAFSCKVGVAGSAPGALDLVSYWVADGISVGPAGDVYVADIGNDRVQVYGKDGTYRRSFGSAGTQGGQLDTPISVEAGDEQAVYVVDRLNERVQKFRDSSAGAATFRFSAATYSNAETGLATITVTRAGDLSVPVSVSYATSDGSAQAGPDYVAASGRLRFGAGETSKTFLVDIVEDEDSEGDETVTLALSAPSYGDSLVAPGTATLTILEDDGVNTTITSGPTGDINDLTPTYTFTSTPSGPGYHFECSIDSQQDPDFTPCVSGVTIGPLTEGNHVFYVRGVHGTPVDLKDLSPAHADISVDTVAPVTALTDAPGPQSGNQQIAPHVFVGIVKVTAAVTDAHSTTTRCQLDGTAPVTYAALPTTPCPVSVFGTGTHRVYAASRDTAGNDGPVTSTTFEILAEPNTVIDSGPSGEVFIKNPSFGFHSTVFGSTFECRIDEGAFGRCTNPYVTAPLATGPHTFRVRATSPDGIVDPSPALRTFTVGGTRTASGDCTIGDYPGGIYYPGPHECYIGAHSNDVDCAKDYLVCVRTNIDCPVYSTCAVSGTLTWVDADPAADWLSQLTAAAIHTPQYSVTSYCNTGAGGHRCVARATVSGIVAPRDANSGHGAVNCVSFIPAGQPNRLGDAAGRTMRCEAKVTYSPAVTLQPVGSGATMQALVPGAGTVTVSTGGSGKRAARAGALSVVKNVTAAGVVTVKPKLPKKLKRKLKAGKKVKVKVSVTYRSPGGTVVSRTGKITLQKTKKAKEAKEAKEAKRLRPGLTALW